MAFLSSYKALLFDVDNTLANSNKVVPEGIGPLLDQLTEQGFHIGVCTGRSYPALHHYILPFFPSDSLHIVSGGSQLTTSQGEVKWEQLIPASISQPLAQALKAIGAEYYFVSQNDAIYASPKYAQNLSQHPWQISVQSIEVLENWPTPLMNVLEVNDQVREVVGEYLGDLIVKEMPYQETKTYFDITARGVTKAVGIQAWCEATGLPANQIIGFGDSANDLEFLDAIGYGVVMGNGSPEAKAIADRIIDPVDENGLVTYLTAILKGEPL